MNRRIILGLGAAIVMLATSACYDSQTISRDSTAEPAAKSQAQEVLEANGFTDIELTGYAMFSCAEEDTFRTGFVAKSPAGQKVKGAVCSGWFKGGTIRITGTAK